MWSRLWQRLMNLFKANANDALDRAEDPIKMMKLAIAEMELSISKSTEALAKAMGNHKNLKTKLEAFQAESLSWYGKAAQAIKTGNEDLGKKALEKKALVDAQIDQYTNLVEHSGATVEQLKVQLDRMKVKLDEARSKESILVAKVENAKAHKEISQQLSGVSYTPLSDFKKYEEKINKIEAEAQSYTELAENNTKLERDFENLEKESKISTELEMLKNDLYEVEMRKRAEEEAKKEQRINQMFNQQNNVGKLESKPQPPLLNNDDTKDKQKLIDEFFKKNNP